MASEFSSRHLEDWQQKYAAVFRETDRLVLFKRVEEAEAAIRLRREALGRASEPEPGPQALDAALAQLGVVKKELLHFKSDT